MLHLSVSEQEGCLKLRPVVTEQATRIHQPSRAALWPCVLGGQIRTSWCGSPSPLSGGYSASHLQLIASPHWDSPNFWILSPSRNCISLLCHWFSVHRAWEWQMMFGWREAVGLLLRSGKVYGPYLFGVFRKWNTDPFCPQHFVQVPETQEIFHAVLCSWAFLLSLNLIYRVIIWHLKNVSEFVDLCQIWNTCSVSRSLTCCWSEQETSEVWGYGMQCDLNE